MNKMNINTKINTKNNDTLSSRILKRIEDENIKPESRFRFLFKNYVFWGAGAFAIVFGAFAVSAMFFEIMNVDWRFAPVIHNNLFSLFIESAPYLWIFSLLIFIAIGYINIRLTKNGYRYKLSTIVIGAILTSISLGSAMHLFGVGEIVERGIGNGMPFHRSMMMDEKNWWSAPDNGFIGGTVIAIAQDFSTFTVRDFSDKKIIVNTNDLNERDRSAVALGESIRVVGLPMSAISTEQFHSCFVFPWGSGNSRRGQIPALPQQQFPDLPDDGKDFEKSKECESIRPYRALRDLDVNNRF